MWVCPRILLFLGVLHFSLVGLAQDLDTDDSPLRPFPRDLILTDLGTCDLTVDEIQELEEELDLKYHYTIKDILRTPMYYFDRQEYYFSSQAFSNIIKVYPAVINDPKINQVIFSSLSATKQILDITDQLWALVAENYDNPEYSNVENMLYSAMADDQKIDAQVDQNRLEEAILDINSPLDELKISMPFLHNQLLITQHSREQGERFYYSRLVDGEWSDYRKTPFLELMENAESAASIDGSGKYVVFTKCMDRAWDATSGGGCDLWFSTFIDDSTWSGPRKYGEGINTPFYDGLASFSMDGRYLLFSSDRPGGYGGLDIWYSKWDGALWSLPQNAGPLVNSKADESSPYICEDGVTIFYASNKKGNYDLYQGIWQDEKISATYPLPKPINTDADEITAYVITGNNKLVVSSNDKNKYPDRNFDFKIFDLPVSFSPIPRFAISGQILFTNSLKPNFSEYSLKTVNDIDLLQPQFTNKGNGWFFWNLKQTDELHYVTLKNIEKLSEKQFVMPVGSDKCSTHLNWNFIVNP